jgi:hypothetical protein
MDLGRPNPFGFARGVYILLGCRLWIVRTVLSTSLVSQNILFQPLPVQVFPLNMLNYVASGYLAMLQFLVPFHSTQSLSDTWSP